MDAAQLSRLGLVCGLLLTPTVARAEEKPRPDAKEAAARLDAAFLRASGKTPGPVVEDETFLRRVSIDLTGKLPDADDIHRFLNDRSADKRARFVDRLLESDAYAVNWGRYWRDVLTYHTTASGNYLRWQLFDRWWADQLRRNRPWNEVVSALVTATGVNDENAPVNYLTGLYGNPVEIASTTSRVFLGQQIQCAECHHAKTEPWKREQFHEFAAFFGRALLIQHKDVSGRGTPYAIEPRAEGQYRMTDKKDPDRLIAMQPRFLTGEAVSIDADDQERRQFLARRMTSPDNPWFARCYVNRMWTSMLGWGFYPAVNDLGTSVKPRYAKTLEMLEKDWIASGYDVKWLFRTIALTQVYQGRIQPRPAGDDTELAACVCPVPLRPEQVFEALQKSLAFDENDKSIPAPAPTSSPAVQRHTGTRNMVYQYFKVNPSLPFQEIHGTIPQALVMMNSTLVHQYTRATGKTVLADLLAKKLSDEDTIAALYERVLARKPSSEERGVCLRYLGKVQDRSEALEDILWALVNSTEFLIKK